MGNEIDEILTLEDGPKKSKWPYMVIGLVVFIIFIGVLSFVIISKYNHNIIVNNTPDIAEAKAYVQEFTLHFYNLSAGYFETERDKCLKYMSSEVLKAYQDNFFDPDLLNKINKHNLATSFDIQRLDFIAKGETEYQFRIIGNVKFTSLKLGTYIQFPFSHTIITQKTTEGFKITDITIN